MAAAATLFLLGARPVLACETASIGSDARHIKGSNFSLAWRVDPAPLKLGEFFSVVVSTCGAEPVSRLKVDATMPAHQHGMNYLPSVVAEGNGRFRADGLLLHMPGRWELAFDVASSQARETLRASFDLR
ncbi:MAG: hypothetical protein ACREBN_02040 [Burkholderiaceae bacterium]